VNGRLPLFTAAERSLKWNKMEQIFTAYMPVIQEIDDVSGLPLFMLAAAGPASDIESVYNLLNAYPAAIGLTGNIYYTSPTNGARKRWRNEVVKDSNVKLPKL